MMRIPIIVVTVSILAGCGQRTGQIPEVRIALTLGTFGHTAIPLAQSLGYFEQEGVRVTLAGMAGSAKVMEAMIGGSAEIGASSLEQAAQLTAEGRPVKAFVMQFSGLPFPLVVSPKAAHKIERIEDLRNARVGITAIGSQTHFMVNYILSKHGIGPDAITTSSIGLGGTNVAAIESGRVDAGVTSPTGLELLRRRHADLKLLYDPLDAKQFREIFGTDRYPSHVLCARTEWLARNPDTARKLARAVVRALRHLHDRPVAESVAKLPPEYRSGEPSADIAALQRWLPSYSTDGVFPDDGYEAVLRVVSVSVEKVRLANIDARSIYTNEFVRGKERDN